MFPCYARHLGYDLPPTLLDRFFMPCFSCFIKQSQCLMDWHGDRCADESIGSLESSRHDGRSEGTLRRRSVILEPRI